jgi:hypothetical protein
LPLRKKASSAHFRVEKNLRQAFPFSCPCRWMLPFNGGTALEKRMDERHWKPKKETLARN